MTPDAKKLQKRDSRPHLRSRDGSTLRHGGIEGVPLSPFLKKITVCKRAKMWAGADRVGGEHRRRYDLSLMAGRQRSRPGPFVFQSARLTPRMLPVPRYRRVAKTFGHASSPAQPVASGGHALHLPFVQLVDDVARLPNSQRGDG
jgi:hypothetical protein